MYPQPSAPPASPLPSLQSSSQIPSQISLPPPQYSQITKTIPLNTLYYPQPLQPYYNTYSKTQTQTQTPLLLNNHNNTYKNKKICRNLCILLYLILIVTFVIILPICGIYHLI